MTGNSNDISKQMHLETCWTSITGTHLFNQMTVYREMKTLFNYDSSLPCCTNGAACQSRISAVILTQSAYNNIKYESTIHSPVLCKNFPYKLLAAFFSSLMTTFCETKWRSFTWLMSLFQASLEADEQVNPGKLQKYLSRTF